MCVSCQHPPFNIVSVSDSCIQFGDKLLGGNGDKTSWENRLVSNDVFLSLTIWFHHTEVTSSRFITGYPAARRCHSCVQVKNGRAFWILEQIDEAPLVWSGFFELGCLFSHLKKSLYVAAIMERSSCRTCGRSTCKPFSGPSCLRSCQNQRTFTVLLSLRWVICHTRPPRCDKVLAGKMKGYNFFWTSNWFHFIKQLIG